MKRREFSKYSLLLGPRGGEHDQIVRVQGKIINVPQGFIDGAFEIGMGMVKNSGLTCISDYLSILYISDPASKKHPSP
jgi:hypothetical protein